MGSNVSWNQVGLEEVGLASTTPHWQRDGSRVDDCERQLSNLWDHVRERQDHANES